MMRMHRAGLAGAAIAAMLGVAGLTSAQAAAPADGTPSPVAAARASATGLDLGQAADLTVRDVVVDGQIVVRERRVLTVDEERVKAECQERGERILRDIGGG